MDKKKRIIMVVDDNIDFLKQFQEMLKLSGYKTKGFASGEEALQSVKQVRPDLILLDLKMEGKSGFDVAQDLKSDPATENIAVIIVSGFCTKQDCKVLLEKDKVKRCIRKPVKPLDIINEIETVLTESRDSDRAHKMRKI